MNFKIVSSNFVRFAVFCNVIVLYQTSTAVQQEVIAIFCLVFYIVPDFLSYLRCLAFYGIMLLRGILLQPEFVLNSILHNVRTRTLEASWEFHGL